MQTFLEKNNRNKAGGRGCFMLERKGKNLRWGKILCSNLCQMGTDLIARNSASRLKATLGLAFVDSFRWYWTDSIGSRGRQLRKCIWIQGTNVFSYLISGLGNRQHKLDLCQVQLRPATQQRSRLIPGICRGSVHFSGTFTAKQKDSIRDPIDHDRAPFPYPLR